MRARGRSQREGALTDEIADGDGDTVDRQANDVGVVAVDAGYPRTGGALRNTTDEHEVPRAASLQSPGAPTPVGLDTTAAAETPWRSWAAG